MSKIPDGGLQGLEMSADYKEGQSLPASLPTHCLFCNNEATELEQNLDHMLKAHGLFIPAREHLVVDVETLMNYLHTVIFHYRECISCEVSKQTTEAIQQHMLDKGHCKISLDPDSEYSEFYDFAESSSDSEFNSTTTPHSNFPTSVDSEMHLPSGKVITSRSSTSRRIHHSKYHPTSSRANLPSPSSSTSTSLTPLSKRQQKQLITLQITQNSQRQSDRTSLIGLTPQEQRVVLATEKTARKLELRGQNEERAKVERFGNKQKYYRADGPARPLG
ncbi:putative pre-60s factor [Phaeomoniella chlamydospora]|uniref:Putative pre-60s factor n=1 Tax=Phaeomoniella chlamydospora TaxID=158046 RepID=A0A0G2EJL6_PHACM|nr:putative pre-60s factor [Phaeomoniella chlamydospora]